MLLVRVPAHALFGRWGVANPDSRQVRCPLCHAPVCRSAPDGAPYFPFCSERCRLIDLGKWLDGEYRIEGPPRAPEGEEGPGGQES